MKVAALERFSDPSRRCDPCHVEWDLPHFRESPVECLRLVPQALTGWLAMKGDLGDRRRLFRACLRTRGAAIRRSAARAGAARPSPTRGGRRARRRTRPRTSVWRTSWRVDWTAAAARPSRTAPNTSASSPSAASGHPLCVLAAHAGPARAHGLHPRHPAALLLLSPSRGAPDPAPVRADHRGSRRPRRMGPLRPEGASKGARRPSLASASLQSGVRRQPVRLGPRVMRHLQRGPPTSSIAGIEALPTSSTTAHCSRSIGRVRTRYQVVYVRPRPADIVNDHQAIGNPRGHRGGGERLSGRPDYPAAPCGAPRPEL